MKYLVVFHKANSRFDRGFQEFESGEEPAMQEFIDKKVLSGLTCHSFDYRDTYQLNKSVQSTTNNNIKV